MLNQLNALNVKQFTQGICFICQKPCTTEAYVHTECAVAYHDEKAKRIKDANAI